MSNKHTVVVFGAAGMLGASVARSLAHVGTYNVKGVTSGREVQCRGVQQLESDGVQLVHCDLGDVESLRKVLMGATACFVTTATDFSDPNCMATEINQGREIAKACHIEGVMHVVYSSQLNPMEVCSIKAQHLMAKADIEQYMRELRLPLTSLILPVFYESLCGDILRPRTRDGRQYDLEIPMGQTPLDMISVEDVGDLVATVLLNRHLFLEKTLSVCGDKIYMREIAQCLSKYLRPKTFKDKQLTVYEFSQARKDIPGVTDWANMFQFFQRVDQRYNLTESKKLNDRIRSFEQWVSQNVDMLDHDL